MVYYSFNCSLWPFLELRPRSRSLRWPIPTFPITPTSAPFSWSRGTRCSGRWESQKRGEEKWWVQILEIISHTERGKTGFISSLRAYFLAPCNPGMIFWLGLTFALFAILAWFRVAISPVCNPGMISWAALSLALSATQSWQDLLFRVAISPVCNLGILIRVAHLFTLFNCHYFTRRPGACLWPQKPSSTRFVNFREKQKISLDEMTDKKSAQVKSDNERNSIFLPDDEAMTIFYIRILLDLFNPYLVFKYPYIIGFVDLWKLSTFSKKKSYNILCLLCSSNPY